MSEKKRVTMKDASRILGMHPVTIRYMMRAGELPIGRIVKSKSGVEKYWIFEDMLNEFIGAKK